MIRDLIRKIRELVAFLRPVRPAWPSRLPEHCPTCGQLVIPRKDDHDD